MKAASIVALLLAGHSHAAAAEATTIYFVRHSEHTRTTKFLGNATSSYDVVWDGNDKDVSPRQREPTAGAKNIDEVCGTAKCAMELSDLGLVRARLLADYLASIGVAAPGSLVVYASHKYRAWQTAAPIATLAELDGVVQLPEGGTELDPERSTASICPTVEALQGHGAGSTVLVVGHANTLYKIMGDGNRDCDGLGVDMSDDDRFPKGENGGVPADQFGNLWIVEIDGDGEASLKERRVLDFALTVTTSTASQRMDCSHRVVFAALCSMLAIVLGN